MIDPNTKLTIYHSDSLGIFQNYSDSAFDFARDEFTLQLTTEDYLYIGFYKPISCFYVQIKTTNTVANTFNIEAFNGSSWSSISANDDTKGFTRSGFITFDRTDLGQTEVNNVNKHWVRLSPTVNHASTVISAINFVFCDDNDLVYEVPEITDTNHLAGKTSHILTHVAVRNQILQSLNNKNYTKTNPETGIKEDLTCWDVLNVHQLKQAAMFLALSKIYFNFSDDVADKFYQKHKDYESRFQSAFELSRLALDDNDDGLVSTEEVMKENFNILRIKR